MKTYLLPALAVFIAWSILDYLIHGQLLMGLYASTASLWRPMEEMSMGLTTLVTALVALAFAAVYAYQIHVKSVASGTRYGALFGLATGVSMGFGSYAYLPIPYSLAWGWFLGSLVKGVAGGAILGWFSRKKP